MKKFKDNHGRRHHVFPPLYALLYSGRTLAQGAGHQKSPKIRVDLQPEQRDLMIEKTGRRTVPQIYIGWSTRRRVRRLVGAGSCRWTRLKAAGRVARWKLKANHSFTEEDYGRRARTSTTRSERSPFLYRENLPERFVGRKSQCTAGLPVA